MTDSRPIMEQYNELLGILERFTQHKMNMDEAIQVSCIIDKLPPFWKDFKHTLKHLKEELTLVELGSHLRIEESLKVQDSDKPKGNNVAGPSVVNMVEHDNLSRYNDNKGKRKHHDNTRADPNKKAKPTCWKCDKTGHIKRDCKGVNVGNKANGSGTKGSVDGSSNSLKGFLSTSKLNDSILWHAKLSHVHFKRMQDMSKDGLILAFDMDTKKTESRVLGAVVRLPVPKLKTLGERGIECIFVGYAKHSKAFRFYVIEPNESVLINYIIESMYEIFDENRFSSVPRLILRIPNRTKDIGGLLVPQEVTEEVVTQQPEPELRKGKRNRTPNNFGPKFQLCLIEGTRDDVFDQHSYFLNIEDDPKTFDEAMKSQDVAIWKEAFNDETDSIMGNNTWVLADLPLGCKPLGYKWIFKRKLKMDVKTAFLNGELDEEVYMNQPQGFIMSGNENKVCKLINKFDETGKGVIICLYVDDMLIFGTYQVQVDLAKEFFSLRFYMKDMKEADVILVSTPIDISEKLMPNNVGKLSMYTSNPGTQHWQAIQRVLKYLKKNSWDIEWDLYCYLQCWKIHDAS
ncbi:zinc finger, CCHC-type containing protein [Tanacetum coccineum]